uniref:Uncharacterized protein n=1 Tax=Klebsiella pneumoniae TaxID=573 RepID=A0A2P1BN88_KLEPN|nr:hypothetical protein [Klebsiella pneumoniae]
MLASTNWVNFNNMFTLALPRHSPLKEWQFRSPHLLRHQDLLCNLEVHRSCNNSTLLRDVDS